MKAVSANYADESIERRERLEQEEREYQAARAERERRDRMMQENPLRLMFETEDDPERRRVMERDMALLTSLGFSDVHARKALFVCSGVHHDAVNWLIQHQHNFSFDFPWNMSELQVCSGGGGGRSTCETRKKRSNQPR